MYTTNRLEPEAIADYEKVHVYSFYPPLVGGFNPFEKYARQIGIIFPKGSGWKFQKYLSCHHLVLYDMAYFF